MLSRFREANCKKPKSAQTIEFCVVSRSEISDESLKNTKSRADFAKRILLLPNLLQIVACAAVGKDFNVLVQNV